PREDHIRKGRSGRYFIYFRSPCVRLLIIAYRGVVQTGQSIEKNSKASASLLMSMEALACREFSLRRFAMKVRDVMTPQVEVIRPDATLKEAAEKMSRLEVGPLPVCESERLVGILTDRDITIRAVSAGCDPNTTRVHEAMTREVVYCYE